MKQNDTISRLQTLVAPFFLAKGKSKMWYLFENLQKNRKAAQRLIFNAVLQSTTDISWKTPTNAYCFIRELLSTFRPAKKKQVEKTINSIKIQNIFLKNHSM